jgi:hypothetical protein
VYVLQTFLRDVPYSLRQAIKNPGSALTIAVAEPDGEVRSLGIIPNREESVRKLVKKLGLVVQRVLTGSTRLLATNCMTLRACGGIRD